MNSPLRQQTAWTNPWLAERFVNWLNDGPVSPNSLKDTIHCCALLFAAIESIVQYMTRCPFSLERFVNVSPDGQVFYRTENAECRPIAFEYNEGEKSHPVKRNFQHFKPLDFIAELTQHIPDPGGHLIRHYGWYANKTHGLREKRKAAVAPDNPKFRCCAHSPGR